MPDDPKIAELEAEIMRLRPAARIAEKLWFFFAGIVPQDWRDRTLVLWMKQDEKRSA